METHQFDQEHYGWCPYCSRVVWAPYRRQCVKCGTEVEEQGTGDDDPYPEED